MAGSANRWLLSICIAGVMFAASCSSAAVGSALYPDVDPGPDVDYIGEAVSMTREELDQQREQEDPAPVEGDSASGSI
jgi:hypothetical protein